MDSPIFPHFGETKYFAIVDIVAGDKRLLDMKILENPFRKEPKRKGIMVAEWLGEQQVDKVFVKEALKKGPMYTFDSFYIQVVETKHDLLKDIIDEVSEQEK